MEAFVRATRRGGVILVTVVSIVAALGLVYGLFHTGAVERQPTMFLLVVLGLLVLPIVTLGLLRLDQTTARERGGAR